MEKFLEIRRTWRNKEITEENLRSLIEYNNKIIVHSEDCPTVVNFRKDLIKEMFALHQRTLLANQKKIAELQCSLAEKE